MIEELKEELKQIDTEYKPDNIHTDAYRIIQAARENAKTADDVVIDACIYALKIGYKRGAEAAKRA